MRNTGTVFSRPDNPAAKCLHLTRLSSVITRAELVEATGLSQPTITRAVTALIGAGLLAERTDLTQSRGRGRPIIPVKIGDNDWMLAGLAVGTTATYIALYDNRGRIIAEEDVPTPVASLSEDDFIEHLMAGVHRLSTGSDRKLVSVGVATSGSVSPEGLVHAPNLGWDNMDIAQRLRYQFDVPVTVSAAVPAILGSETQTASLDNTPTVMVLFADDSLGAALSNDEGVHTLALPSLNGQAPENTLVTTAINKQISKGSNSREVLTHRAQDLGKLAAKLIEAHRPDTLVIAGGAFYDDPQAPRIFAAEVRAQLKDAPQLRLIPSHRDIVRSIARAVALDPLLRQPLTLNK
ncbi:Crp/Fnr family transcriptional regulator [Corynebacterium phocae]|uniref:Crp/Fnr family transcriptional regulator n=1 Tax=Corynebacterium phocae TaxID=161895 RepID=A0A1L7D0F5_9CORY|nr:ROK family transcriptional regulator [Corynebacterium phocae]APT91625.1 Crp/Fnr family transcriptional regulator [Corynebacterium phocae]KAA8720703.1 ROK family transcriptional regulator [Corynebacterium phocae]